MSEYKNEPDGSKGSELVSSLIALAFFGVLFAGCGGFLYFWSISGWSIWSLIAMVGVVSVALIAISIPLSIKFGGNAKKDRGEYWREVRRQEREK